MKPPCLQVEIIFLPRACMCIGHRIQSLYWYEHVDWLYEVQGTPEECRSFREWVDEWRDSGAWKQKVLTGNPFTVYVEIGGYVGFGDKAVTMTHRDDADDAD